MKWTANTLILFLFAASFCQECIADDGFLKSNCIEESGVQQTENRAVGSFDSIDIKGSFNLTITSRKNFSVIITCDGNLIPHISTEVRSKKLFIYSNRSICSTKGIDISISAPDIREVNASGSNDISVTGIANNSISITLDGAGDLTISGNTKKFEANLFGSNHLHAKNLRSEETSISIAGSSDAAVFASEVLKINIGGVGGIIYYGNPNTIVKEISGIGTIRPAD